MHSSHPVPASSIEPVLRDSKPVDLSPPTGRRMGHATFLRFLLDTMGTIEQLAATNPSVVSYRAAGQGLHLAFAPNVLRQVFVDHPDRYEKLYNQLAGTTGHSSLLLSGEAWRKRRDRNWPLFRGSVLSDRLAEEQANIWSYVANEGPKVDQTADVPIFDVTSDITFAMAGRLFCGTDLVPSPQAVRNSVYTLAEVDQWTLGAVFPPWRWILMALTPGYSKARSHWLDSRARIAASGDADAEIPAIQNIWRKAMRDKPDAEIDEQALDDEVATMIVAGSHTTAASFAFTLHLLAHHPEWKQRVEEEAMSAWKEGAETAPIDFDAMPVTRAVLQEALRIYPPVWVVSRRALSAHTLDGVEVRKGDVVVVPLFAIHRSPHLWDEPERFNPERFLGKTSYGYRYLPFGAGPRMCIGNRIALQEQTALISAFLAQYKVDPLPGTKPLTTPELLPGVAIWTRKPHQLRLTLRV